MLKEWKRLFDWVKTWAEKFYPGKKSWFFLSLIISFLFLALSGFLFTLFISRGLYGVPLLLHVAGGGIFAICLSMAVVWRAKDYTLDADQSVFLKIMFWMFVLSGLCLMVTSLSSMLSFLTMQIQVGMIRWHRFFALVSLFSVSAFIYYSLDREK